MVDDHPVYRAGLRGVLEQESDMVVVREGASGADAVEIAAAREADVLVLDVAMPGLSGLEALREVRRCAPTLRVLVVSGYAPADYGKRMIDRGADGYLHKDCDPQAVVAAVRCVLTGQRHIPPVVAAQFATWWAEGDASPLASLSEREYEVLVKLASGLDLTATARGLRVAKKTVAARRTLILRKLNLTSDVGLTCFALKHNLIAEESLFR